MKSTGFLRRSLRRSSFLAATFSASALPLIMVTSPAEAGDWSFQGRVGEKADFYDNYRMLTDPNGYVLLSSTSLFGNLYYTTPDSRFDLIADIVARGYAGPGSDKLRDNIFPSLSAKYRKDGKRTGFNLGADYSYQYIPAIEEFDVNNDLINNSSSSKHTLKVNFGITHKIDSQNSLNFDSSASRSIFTGDGVDSLFINNSVTWNRKMTRRTDGTLTFGFDWLSREDDDDTQRYVYRTRAGLTSKLTKRLSGNIGAGLNLVNTHKTDLETTSKLGYSADAGLNYALKTLSIAFSASYGLQQGTLGDIQKRLSTSLSVSKTINERSSVAVRASAQTIQSVDDTGNNGRIVGFSIAPTYSYTLTRDWSMLAGYRFTIKDRDDGKAMAHNVFVSFSRTFGLKP